ncbi:MAG: hypothetical protein MJZ34_10645 [Paludibacteraceae bacterium]|nr:hypothetical protein [Paludibacteraceae bacterium]
MDKILDVILPVLCVITTAIFIALKLFNVIDWSWVWIISPIWIFVAFVYIVIIFCMIFSAIKSLKK